MDDQSKLDRVADVNSQIETLRMAGEPQTFKAVEEITGIPYQTLKNAQKTDKINIDGKNVVIDDTLREYIYGHKLRPSKKEEGASDAQPDDVQQDDEPAIPPIESVASPLPGPGFIQAETTAEDALRAIEQLQRVHTQQSKALLSKQGAEMRTAYRLLGALTKTESAQVRKMKEILDV